MALDQQQLARRRLVEARPGVKIYVYTPEDILFRSCAGIGKAPALGVEALLGRALTEGDG